MLKKTILDLLKDHSARPVGAIQIAGEWGSGKSYFWNEIIKPDLNSCKILNVYISMAGLNSSDQIYRVLIAQNIQKRIKDVPQMTLGEVLSNIFLILKSSLSNFFKSTLVRLKLSDVFYNWKSLKIAALDSIDLSTFLPSNSVICFDDIERSNVPIPSLLSVIINLQEKYNSKVVIIFNDEKISGDKKDSFYKHKEKLVWRKFTFEAKIHDVFDSFLESFTNKTNHEQFVKLKSTILHPFYAYSQNLRVLSRCLKDVDEILKLKPDVDARHVGFYCSLFLWNHSGYELRDYDLYDGSYSFSTTLDNKMDKTKLSIEEQEGADFLKIFFKSRWNTGALPSLYNFVKTGFLVEAFLAMDLARDVDERTALGLSKVLREKDWFFYSDKQLEELVESILKIFKSDRESKFNHFLALAAHLKKITYHLKVDVPSQFHSLMNETIDRCASRRDECERFNFHEEPEEIVSFVSSIVDAYKAKLDESNRRYLIAQMKNILLSGQEINTMDENFQFGKTLADALVDDELLACVASIASRYPEAHYSFFFRAARRINETGLPEYKSYFLKIKEAISSFVPEDKSATRRKEYLLNMIEKHLAGM